MVVSNELKLRVWQKGRIVKGVNPDIFRKDPCGAWIMWDKYGVKDNTYGWEIDHIKPQAMLEKLGFTHLMIDDLRNLRPMQHKNNVSKSDDYPSYMAVVTSEGNKNINKERSMTVNEATRNILDKLYEQ